MPMREGIYGLLAEFNTPGELVFAAKTAYDSGWRRLDCYTPYPVEEAAEAIGFHRNYVPLICLIGGLMSYVPAAPAHAIQSPYPPMPKPDPIPPNTAEVMRKRMTSGPQMRLNVPAPESAAKPVPYE